MLDIIGHNINTVISSLLSLYLPIDDNGTKLALSIAISSIVTQFVMRMFKMLSFFNGFVNYFWKETYVIINQKNPAYDKIIDYIYTKYSDQILGCKLESDFGKNKMIVDKLLNREIKEPFQFEEKNYIVKIKFGKAEKVSKGTNSDSNGTFTEERDILIYSMSSTTILEKYVNQLIRVCNEKVSNDILIFKLTVSDKKNRDIVWKEYCTRTSKNIRNTIVSNKVKENFYDDIDNFFNKEQYYIDKGLPYKRGYILYGEPGCGKTSLIKAVANHYQLPIFILDLSVLVNNNELTTAVSEISSFVSTDEKYLLVMEDVDRTKMFKSRNKYYYDEDNKGITDDCLLNVLDGVDENYGRITIMTANNYELLTKIKAMMRPGRIDMIVNITLCTPNQIYKILKFYFPENEFVLEDNISITPAKLIQLILVLPDFENVVDILNKYKTFGDLSIEKLLDIKNKKIVDDDNEDDSDDDSKCDSDEDDDDVFKSLRKEELALKLTWKDRKLRRLMSQLKNDKEKLDAMEKNLNAKSEKEKLILEKKKIIVRLQEINVEQRKNECNLLHKKKHRVVKYSQLGLIHIDQQFEKIEKDKIKDKDADNRKENNDEKSDLDRSSNKLIDLDDIDLDEIDIDDIDLSIIATSISTN
jgi:hypothetical protein